MRSPTTARKRRGHKPQRRGSVAMWVGAPHKLQPLAPGPLSGHSMTVMDGCAVVFGGEQVAPVPPQQVVDWPLGRMPARRRRAMLPRGE